MRAEDLISLAACHGVDLVAAAKVGAPSRPRDVKVKFREWGAATVLLEPPKNRARGTASMSIERAPWTIAELGQAAAGVPQIEFCAACFAFAGDMGQFWKLHGALHLQAATLAEEHRWPARVKDVHSISVQYLRHLAKLVLDHDANQSQFAVCEPLYAIYMNVPEHVWKRQLSGPFVELQTVWLGWLSDAMRIMQPRLRSDED